MKRTLIVIIFILIAIASIYGQNTQQDASQTGKTTDSDIGRELESYLSSFSSSKFG